MSTSLLTSKLYIPPLRSRSRVVPRPRLIERLNTGLDGRLTLVSAPAGFGKTTLLSEWIHASGATQASPLQVAWASLDEGDNDPARFWTYVLAALNTLQPGLGDDALALLRAPQPSPIEAVLTTLINGVASLPQGHHRGRPYVLVLDDYHVVESPAIHEALAFLLDHLPPQLHLLLSGRADPPLPLSRLRARGELAELRADDLRFTPAEAVTFLNQVMGLDLSAADIAVLETRTEGWIAGLQLAALSMRGREPERTASFIQAFSGSHRYILDYLVEEVLRRQPEAIQSFLLQTSILDRLSGSLCDAILGDQRPALPSSFVQGPSSSSAQAILEYLEAANLFLVALDDERRWYRYHRLFGDLLRANLLQTHPGRVPELHRRAAAWYERHGSLAEAVGHRLAAGDVEAAADLIEQSAGEMLWVRGEVATLLRWLAMLPEPLVCSRPRLCLAYAWALFLSIQFEAVEARMQDAERALHEARLPDESPERQDMVGQLAVMRAMLANFQGDIPRTLSLSRQALALVPESNLLLRAALAGNLGGAYAGIGNLVAAAEAFAEAARLYRATGSAFGTLLASSYAGNMQLALGQLGQAAAIYRHTLRLAAEFGGRTSLGTRIAHVGLGRLSYEWNDLEDAKHHLVSAIEEAERQGDENVGPGP